MGRKNGGGLLRLWWVYDELNTLLDVAFETLNALLEELLLIGVGAAQDVDSFLCTGWLRFGISSDTMIFQTIDWRLTPSSTGTEK